MTNYRDIVGPGSIEKGVDVIDFDLGSDLFESGFSGVGRLGDSLALANGSSVNFISPSRNKKLVTVALGNSITAYMQKVLTTSPSHNELMLINAMSGGAMEFPEIIATSGGSTGNVDARGFYGYSGATIAQINADLDAKFWKPLNDSNVVPDIIVGLSLYENDMTAPTPITTIVSETEKFLAKSASLYPNTIRVIYCPRPGNRYNTPASQLLWQQTVDYLNTLKTRKNVRIQQIKSFAKPDKPWQAKTTIANCTVTGTNIVVNSILGEPLALFSNFEAGGSVKYINGVPVNSQGLPASGYTVNAAPAAGNGTYEVEFSKYTDGGSSGIHPTAIGAGLAAREAFEDTFASLLSSPAASYRAAIQLLEGSTAATGTGNSGTMPTGMTLGGNPTGVTAVCQALNPGFRITYNGAHTGTSSASLAAISAAGWTTSDGNYWKFIPRVTFKIIEGAEYLWTVTGRYTVTDNGAGSGNINYIFPRNFEPGGAFLDNVEYSLGGTIIPGVSGGTGLSTGFCQILPVQTAGAPASAKIVIEVYDAGFDLPAAECGETTLVAGVSPAIAVSSRLTANTKIMLSVKTLGGTPGALFVSTRTNGTSFVISSTNVLDTSVVAWELVQS
jgi:hypothetical protein